MTTAARISDAESAQKHPRVASLPKSATWQPRAPSMSGNVIQRKASCACGGGCPRCAEDAGVVSSSNLAVSHPGDAHEREADRVADHIMLMPPSGANGGAWLLSRDLSPTLRRKFSEYDSARHRVGNEVAQSDVMPGAGYPLSDSERAFFEPRFGHDFSGVRVHAGARAAELARSFNARAYTLGRDIVFGEGQYAPETPEGRKLLAHELTHTIQQTSDPLTNYERQGSLLLQRTRVGPSSPRDPLPCNADWCGLSDYQEDCLRCCSESHRYEDDDRTQRCYSICASNCGNLPRRPRGAR